MAGCYILVSLRMHIDSRNWITFPVFGVLHEETLKLFGISVVCKNDPLRCANDDWVFTESDTSYKDSLWLPFNECLANLFHLPGFTEDLLWVQMLKCQLLCLLYRVGPLLCKSAFSYPDISSFTALNESQDVFLHNFTLCLLNWGFNDLIWIKVSAIVWRGLGPLWRLPFVIVGCLVHDVRVDRCGVVSDHSQMG
jgi:hypothetical protein